MTLSTRLVAKVPNPRPQRSKNHRAVRPDHTFVDALDNRTARLCALKLQPAPPTTKAPDGVRRSKSCAYWQRRQIALSNAYDCAESAQSACGICSGGFVS